MDEGIVSGLGLLLFLSLSSFSSLPLWLSFFCCLCISSYSIFQSIYLGLFSPSFLTGYPWIPPYYLPSPSQDKQPSAEACQLFVQKSPQILDTVQIYGSPQGGKITNVNLFIFLSVSLCLSSSFVPSLSQMRFKSIIQRALWTHNYHTQYRNTGTLTFDLHTLSIAQQLYCIQSPSPSLFNNHWHVSMTGQGFQHSH